MLTTRIRHSIIRLELSVRADLVEDLVEHMAFCYLIFVDLDRGSISLSCLLVVAVAASRVLLTAKIVSCFRLLIKSFLINHGLSRNLSQEIYTSPKTRALMYIWMRVVDSVVIILSSPPVESLRT